MDDVFLSGVYKLRWILRMPKFSAEIKAEFSTEIKMFRRIFRGKRIFRRIFNTK
jgi:hypothetical protein